MLLFKYLSPDRTDILENFCFRFTPANLFNDPFECLPDTRIVENSKWIDQIERDIVPEILVSDIIQEVAMKRPRRWTEEKIKTVYRKRYSQRIPELKQIAQEEIFRTREPLRIFCLSQVAPELPAALPMWGHYTISHSGFVLELDPENEWIVAHRPIPGEPHNAGPVLYGSKRTTLPMHSGQPKPADNLIFVKSTEWAYEQEYRLLRIANTPGVDSSKVDALVKFPPSLIRRLIFGLNATKSFCERVASLCSTKELAHVRLQYAMIHPDEYRVLLKDL